MAPRPNQVDVHHHVAAHIIGKEMEAQIAVKGQQCQRDGQHRERGDNQYVGTQRRPCEHRHLKHRHTRCTHFQYGDEEVNPGQCGPDPRQLECPYPVIHPDTGTVR